MIIKRQSFFDILQVFCNAYYKIHTHKKKKKRTHILLPSNILHAKNLSKGNCESGMKLFSNFLFLFLFFNF